MSYYFSPLLKVFPNSNQKVLSTLASRLEKNSNINTPLRVQHFVAQVGYESGGMRWFEESLNYRVSILISKFKGRITVSEAEQYGRNDDIGQKANQEMIGNIIYGGEYGRKFLGNVEQGDGFRFKGRGLIQLTGRYNYTRYANDKRISLDQAVEYLKTPEGAVDSAFWFWESRKINDFADKDDIFNVTRRVNGGHNGIEARRELLESIKKVITT